MDNKPRFAYVTYITSTPEKLWNALLDARMTEKYWQHENTSDWKPGSKWEHRRSTRIERSVSSDRSSRARHPAVSS